MEKHYLTPEGKAQLEKKLEFYRTVRRPEVLAKLKTAREFGDLSENSEYDAAKSEQAQVEGEISQMENLLLYAEVIDKNNIDSDVVSVGCAVKVLDEDFDEEIEYRITGSTESDPRNNIISNLSPVAQALLGHKSGEEVEVKTPGGIVMYKILSIRI